MRVLTEALLTMAVKAYNEAPGLDHVSSMRVAIETVLGAMPPAAPSVALRNQLIARGVDGHILHLVHLARPEADPKQTSIIHCAVLDALSR